MTRDEAIQIVSERAVENNKRPTGTSIPAAEMIVDALVALGVLKLDVSLSERLAAFAPEAFALHKAADVMGEQRASDWREPARCEPPPEHREATLHLAAPRARYSVGGES